MLGNYIHLLHQGISDPSHSMANGGGKNDAPAAPDYTPVAQANEAAARIAKESADADLAFRKQVYEDGKPQTAALQKLATDVANQQMGLTKTASDRSDEQWKDYTTTYRPNERQGVMDAYGSGDLSDASRARLAASVEGTGPTLSTTDLDAIARESASSASNKAMTRASADTNSAFGQQSRMLTRMGGDPNKIASAAAGLAQNQTLARIGAGNAAYDQSINQGISLRAGQAAQGRNQTNTAGQNIGLSTNAGNSATGNQSAAANAGLNQAQFMAGGFGAQQQAAALQQQGALGLGNLMSGDYRAGLANSGDDGGFGSMLGAAGMIASKIPWSDRRLKENIVQIGEYHNGLPKYEFNYIGDSVKYIGVMAQDVLEYKPDAVITMPNGMMAVNYDSMNISMERAH